MRASLHDRPGHPLLHLWHDCRRLRSAGGFGAQPGALRAVSDPRLLQCRRLIHSDRCRVPGDDPRHRLCRGGGGPVSLRRDDAGHRLPAIAQRLCAISADRHIGRPDPVGRAHPRYWRLGGQPVRTEPCPRAGRRWWRSAHQYPGARRHSLYALSVRVSGGRVDFARGDGRGDRLDFASSRRRQASIDFGSAGPSARRDGGGRQGAARRREQLMLIGLAHYLTVAAILFTLGVFGIFLNRKNVIIMLMSIELMLLAVSINFVAFSVFLRDLVGQVFAMFVLTVAAAEAAIGLAILVVYFRKRGTIAVEDINMMKG